MRTPLQAPRPFAFPCRLRLASALWPRGGAICGGEHERESSGAAPEDHDAAPAHALVKRATVLLLLMITLGCGRPCDGEECALDAGAERPPPLLRLDGGLHVDTGVTDSEPDDDGEASPGAGDGQQDETAPSHEEPIGADGGDSAELDPSVSADGGAPSLVDVEGPDDVPASGDEPEAPPVPFTAGLLGGVPPATSGLLALPGGGTGGPVLTSNNPELLTGPGLLFGNARPLLTRGGETYPLSGKFGVYLHHLVDTNDDRTGGGPGLYITLLVSNPSSSQPVTVNVRGSGYTQDETGGLALGASPDYRVSEDWITEPRAVVREGVVLDPSEPFIAWQRFVRDYREVDGRFELETSGPVYVYVVATTTEDINDCVQMTSGDNRVDAPGDYRISGTPPPPFGREAGIYAHDTWQGTFTLDVPPAPAHAAFMVNTATGQPFSQVQAFPALVHLTGSATEAVGMYGNVYDVTMRLRHDGNGSGPRSVRVTFSSLSTASISRYWDGLAKVNGEPRVVQHTPSNRTTVLANITLAPGEERTVRFEAMVPGLTSISQALAIESL
jgi:hypothetical protein